MINFKLRLQNKATLVALIVSRKPLAVLVVPKSF